MAREFTQASFFDHSTYANVYHAAKIPLEYFLADVLVRADMTRVQWSSDAYAFRRRFELADAQNGGDVSTLQASNLNLPFVNYWYENGTFWQPDDRPFAVNSQQMLRGQWAEGLPARMRAIAVKTPMVATAFYERDEDARLAYELILWETQPKGPVQLATSVKWKDVDIAVPVFVTIEGVTFNPQFNETDWLKSQRMFPVQIKMMVRTYVLAYPHQKPLVDLSDTRPQPPYNTGRLDYGSDDKIYITEQVLLNFASVKQWGTLNDGEDISASVGTDPGDYYDQNASLDEKDGVDGALYTSKSINDTVLDIATGYFSPTEEVYVNACEVDPRSITQTSFKLSWAIRKAELKYLQDVTIKVPGQPEIIITDERMKSQIISGLYPNSEYDVLVLFHSKNGGVRDVHLHVTTADDPNNPTSLKRRRGKLKGMEW
jgi:hypothetical protein